MKFKDLQSKTKENLQKMLQEERDKLEEYKNKKEKINKRLKELRN